jgi:CHAT domain-containing protein/Flp pilus assembly protein TadD
MRGAKVTISFAVSAITALILILSSANVSLYAQAKSNPDSLAKVYNNTGVDFAIAGDYEQASTFFLKSLKIRESLPNYPKFKLANGYINLANLKMELSYLDSAMFYYTTAETILNEAESKPSSTLGILYVQMGSCLTYKQNYADAIHYIRKGISVLQQDSIANSNRIIQSYQKLSNSHLFSGQVYEAINAAKTAYKLAQTANPLYLSQISYSLGNAYFKSENYSDAIMFFKEAETSQKHSNKLTNSVLIGLYNSMGLAYWQQGDLNSASEYFEKGYKIISPSIKFTPHVGMLLRNYARFHLIKNDYSKTEALFTEAIEINQKANRKESYFINSISDFYSPTIAVQCLVGLGDVYRSIYNQNNNLAYAEKAIASYRKSIELFDDLRLNVQDESDRLFITESYHTTYLRAIHLCMVLAKLDPKYIDYSFKLASKAKAAVLYQALNKEKEIEFAGVPSHLLKTEQSLKLTLNRLQELHYEERTKPNPSTKFLQSIENRLFESQQNLKKIVTQIEKGYPKYFALKYDSSSVSIKEIQNKLTRKQLLIDYIIADSALISFAVTKNKVLSSVSKIDSTFFNNLAIFVNEVNPKGFDSINRHSLKRFANSSYYLYLYLLKPYEELLKGRELIVIPHNELASIPFCALVTQNDTLPRGFYSLRYLVKTNSTTYVPSSKIFFDSKKQLPQLNVSAISYAPEYNRPLPDFELLSLTSRQYFGDLPGAEKESNAISKVLNGKQVTGKSISKQQFTNEIVKFDILHLAMHTHINETNPLFSKLVLSVSHDSIEKGMLNIYEIYELNLKCRLAIISACRSGDGNSVKGEGLMSIARGLQYAGCPALIAAQWRVDDFSGAEIMVEFAKNIKNGDNLGRALQKAQFNFIDNADPLRSHPYFWASYQLIGNKSAIYFPLAAKYAFVGLLLLVFGIVIFTVNSKRIKRAKANR